MYTFDSYEVGDLSGKYGNIQGNGLNLQSQLDDNLAFTTGIVSSAGRSIVIHKGDSAGSRFDFVTGNIALRWKNLPAACGKRGYSI